ncbi:hypothetical protein [Streptomyces gilvosporeus]|uniref:Uncharacterized protein n=1 Tax=Streptomyces gilvosporeus TaxID=553510 RepID=A0A1V0TQE3_9ACTN|nr:hypothetical protein [Streptomyces gilvosporeus]ARF55123.1 hypothetical protein B1H19_13760 [Streptomyces gilvosporeus]
MRRIATFSVKKISTQRSLGLSIILGACVLAGASVIPVHAAAPEEPIIVKGPAAQRDRNDWDESIAKCPSGTRVVGGGYEVNQSAHTRLPRTAIVNITANHPLADGSGWRIAAEDGDVGSYAMCAKP